MLSDRTGTVLERNKSSEPALLRAVQKFTASQREEQRREEERRRQRERERDPGTPTAAAQGVSRAVLASPGVVCKLARLAEH